MKAYIWDFVNFEQNDWVWLLLMARFLYNNAKIASTNYTPSSSTMDIILEFFIKKTLISAHSQKSQNNYPPNLKFDGHLLIKLLPCTKVLKTNSW